MAYQKLQVGLGTRVNPNDSFDIPNPSGEVYTGTADALTSETLLVDNNGDFIDKGIKPGMVVYNTSGASVYSSTVDSITDETTLVLSNNNLESFGQGSAYAIYTNIDNPGCVLYVGGGIDGVGDLDIITSSGSEVVLKNVLQGSFVPVQVKRVKAELTTATDILAFW